MRLLTSMLAAAALLCPFDAQAQDRDRYLLLAATRTSTMQQEINDAAARGFRVVAASRTESAEAIVTMERSTGSYRYLLIATTRTGTLQREIMQGVEQGFRVIPRAVTTKRTSGGLFNDRNNQRDEGELLVIMEKGPETIPGLTYQVLATTFTGTLQREMSDTAAKGFELVALVSRGEHIAIFERAR